MKKKLRPELGGVGFGLEFPRSYGCKSPLWGNQWFFYRTIYFRFSRLPRLFSGATLRSWLVQVLGSRTECALSWTLAPLIWMTMACCSNRLSSALVTTICWPIVSVWCCRHSWRSLLVRWYSPIAPRGRCAPNCATISVHRCWLLTRSVTCHCPKNAPTLFPSWSAPTKWKAAPAVSSKRTEIWSHQQWKITAKRYWKWSPYRRCFSVLLTETPGLAVSI